MSNSDFVEFISNRLATASDCGKLLTDLGLVPCNLTVFRTHLESIRSPTAKQSLP
jgi:hypothetical protein